MDGKGAKSRGMKREGAGSSAGGPGKRKSEEGRNVERDTTPQLNALKFGHKSDDLSIMVQVKVRQHDVVDHVMIDLVPPAHDLLQSRL